MNLQFYKKWFKPSLEEKETQAPRFKVFLPGIILGVVALITIGSITLAIVLRRQGYDIFSTNQIQVYFFSPSEGRLYSENRPQPYGNQHDWIYATLGHLRFAPNNRRMASTWPDINPLLGEEETPFFQGFFVNDGTLVIDFYESYLEMPPLQEALFRSALTLTMVGLPFIDEVIIRINDNEWTESAQTIANAPALSAARLTDTQLVLYFIDESGSGLVRKYYDATDIDDRRQVQAALERLIEGPTVEGAITIIPPETRILAIIPVVETRSIYVNLSGEFLRFAGGPAARYMIAAIVNTVIANSTDHNLRQVFFLVDFSRAQLPGIDDFTRGFEYDETVMVGFVPDYELEEEDEE